MEDVPPSLHSIFQADLATSLSNKIVASLLSKKKKNLHIFALTSQVTLKTN